MSHLLGFAVASGPVFQVQGKDGAKGPAKPVHQTIGYAPTVVTGVAAQDVAIGIAAAAGLAILGLKFKSIVEYFRGC